MIPNFSECTLIRSLMSIPLEYDLIHICPKPSNIKAIYKMLQRKVLEQQSKDQGKSTLL